jgi:hypothetical protein
MAKMTTKTETEVTLVLSLPEANVVLALVGALTGLGPVRTIANEIYAEMITSEYLSYLPAVSYCLFEPVSGSTCIQLASAKTQQDFLREAKREVGRSSARSS